jgi:electron transport complex protein RnfB
VFPPVAFIDEANCIGCALCLKVCPTDAIVGAFGHMHTVLAADCTGCDKCLPVCPTDCITLEPREGEKATPAQLAARWRLRIKARRARLVAERRTAAEIRARQRAALKQTGIKP